MSGLLESKTIFRNLLSVKMRYEELIAELCRYPDVEILIGQILSEHEGRQSWEKTNPTQKKPAKVRTLSTPNSTTVTG